MAPTVKSEKLTLTYPLFCVDYISPTHLVVAGGGGENRSGVANKITLLELRDGAPQQLGECDLSREEDSVMSLATTRSGQIVGGIEVASPGSPAGPKKKGGNKKKRPAPMARRLSDIPEAEVTALVIAGVNSGMKDQEKGVNEHFRAFKVATAQGSVEPFERRQVFKMSEEQKDIYQRVIRVSPSGAVAVIASGGGKVGREGASEVVVVDTHSFAVRERLVPEGGKEVSDLDVYTVNEVRETLVYSTGDKLYTHTIAASSLVSEQPREVFAVSPLPKGGKPTIRSVRILSQNLIALTLNHPARSGAELLLLSSTGQILTSKRLPSHIKATASLDALTLPSTPTQHLLAIAAADMSIVLYTYTEPKQVSEKATLKLYQTFREVHPFQITKLAFSPVPRTPETPFSSEDEEKSGTGVSDDAETVSLASVSMGNTVVVQTLPLHSTREGLFLSLPGGGIRRTVVTVVASLGVVLVLAVILQLMFMRGFGGLPWDTEEHRGLSGLRHQASDGGKCDETCVGEKDPLLKVVDRVVRDSNEVEAHRQATASDIVVEVEHEVPHVAKDEIVVEVPHVADRPGEDPKIEIIREEL